MTTNDSHLCPQCRSPIDASMKFCGACGAKLSTAASPGAPAEPASAPQTPPEQVPLSAGSGGPPGWPVIVGVVVVLVVLVGLVGGYLFKDYLFQADPGSDETATVPVAAARDENPHILNPADMPGLEPPAEEPLDVAGMGEHPEGLGFDEPIEYDDGSTATGADNDTSDEVLDSELQRELDNVLDGARATYEQLVEEGSAATTQSPSTGIGKSTEAGQPKQAVGNDRITTVPQESPQDILKGHVEKGNKYYREKNYAMAVIEVEQAANMGHSDSQRFMGMMYRDGKGVAQDYLKAREWYEKSASNNDPRAMYALALFYWEGQGVNKDTQKARMLFFKAANLGYARAQYNLGIIYKEGLEVEKDQYESFRWIEMAAKQNLAEALYVVGYDYEHGEGVARDQNKALEYYIKAAELGEKRAIKKMRSHSK